ncbi:MAG TPA: DUF3500 domain-containing protein [Chitinophagaceae bacterium]|nr:DUF3500 domain-containing protein [Chitinophagaceae bacterium]
MTRLNRPILGLVLLLLTLSLSAQQGFEAQIRKPALAFIQTLSPLQRRAALLDFGDTARVKWNNLPVGMRARAGISVGNMTDEQRILFHRLLSAALSSQGYLKATSIMHLDYLLNRFYDSLFYKNQLDSADHAVLASLQWSPRNYFLAFFGLPSDSSWGFKVEGHHLSVNFTCTRGKIAVTPMFVGTDPAEYPTTEYAGWRVLGQEEDLGMQLINSLTPDQRRRATMSREVPEDIITGAESGRRLVDYWGLRVGEMNEKEKAIVRYIIREFVFNLEYDKAVEEYNKILQAGLDKVYFGWIGSYEVHHAYYYILNGPGFLIELDNRGFQNNGNHIHAIWREKGNEFGEDLLRNHYLSEKHGSPNSGHER